jgi:hypothetical protein
MRDAAPHVVVAEIFDLRAGGDLLLGAASIRSPADAATEPTGALEARRLFARTARVTGGESAALACTPGAARSTVSMPQVPDPFVRVKHEQWRVQERARLKKYAAAFLKAKEAANGATQS